MKSFKFFLSASIIGLAAGVAGQAAAFDPPRAHGEGLVYIDPPLSETYPDEVRYERNENDTATAIIFSRELPSAQPVPVTTRFEGIAGARQAHRLYPEHQAERLDGACESLVTVRYGETVSHVAEYCDVSVEDIYAANPGLGNPHALPPGSTLRVPATSGEVYEDFEPIPAAAPRAYERATQRTDHPVGEAAFTHIIRPGDTLGELSKRYNVSLLSLFFANPGVNPNALQVGASLRIPGRGASVAARRASASSDYASYADETSLVSIYPLSGGLDENIHLIGEGLQPGAEVHLLYGPNDDNVRVLRTVRADQDGRVQAVLDLPDSYPYDAAFFAVRRGDHRYVKSETFKVSGATPRVAAVRNGEHRVRDGESIGSIARRYNVTMNELIAINPGLDWNNLQPGREILLPQFASRNVDTRAVGRPILSAVQSRVTPGGEVMLSAEGFEPNSIVLVRADHKPIAPELIATAQTDSNGAFEVSVVAPEHISVGDLVFVAVSENDGRRAESEAVKVRNWTAPNIN